MSSFLGRNREVSEVGALLESSRLVTLTGPPGIGKSRLALELAGRASADYADGTWLVELAPIGDPTLVPRALASALSLQEPTGRSFTDALVAHLRPRALLLVLDNCEHLIAACAEIVDALLRDCPDLRILATSREPLSAAGERVWQVPPLSLPTPAEEGHGSEAMRLFVDRAGAVQPDFSLNRDAEPAVAEICMRLDGIPLAIELAAARIEMLTATEIARRLDDRFALLTKRARGGVPRHQTLQAALDWSHELLSEPERVLLRRLAVFVGGFSLEGAEAVCAGGAVDSSEVFELLARLVSKSLVVADTANSRGRYRLLETIRAYASDRLEEGGEGGALGEAHARFYLALAERAEPELTGPDQDRWLERLEGERENLRCALNWSVDHGQIEWALRLAGALVLFWRVRGHFSEGRDLLDRVISASDGEVPGLEAKALWGAGFMTMMAGDRERATEFVEDSLARYRELGDPEGCARSLLILGNCRQARADPSVWPLLEESASLASEAGDSWCLAHALACMASEHVSMNDPAAARPLYEECLAVARQAQDKQGLRFGLVGLGEVAISQGDYATAESLLEEAEILTAELGEDLFRAMVIRGLGELALGRGQYHRARELIEEALALIPQASPFGPLVESLVLLGRVAHAQGDRPRAHRLFEEFDARAGGRTTIRTLVYRGELAAEEGEPDEARRLLERAHDLGRSSGDKGGMAHALQALGHLARTSGSIERAGALHDEALELQREIGDARGTAASLEAVAGLAAAAGASPQRSALLLGAGQSLRDANGFARMPWESARYEADLARVRGSLSDDEFEAAFAQGKKRSIEEAVAQASKGRRRRGRAGSGWQSLTKAERQVAALAAEGLTNREIAERLFVMPGTVKNHLSHIFSKLGVARRSELAGAVWRRRDELSGADSPATDGDGEEGKFPPNGT